MMRLRTDKVRPFQVGDRSVLRDEAGYLVKATDWDDGICEIIAAEEGIQLTDDHWAVIRFMREHQEQNGVSPDARFIFGFLARTKGLSKNDARRFFFDLFPYGYVGQACKIAGMLQPRAWSSG